MKKLIIIAVAAVLVFSGALAGVVAFLNTPERVAARALTGMIEDLGKREEIAPLGKVLTNGSIAFEVGSKTLNELAGEELKVEGKFYFNEKAMMLDDLSFKYADIKLTGGLYFDEDRIYVENSEILDGTWGLERGTLEEQWKDSVFAPKSGTDVALDEATFNMIGELLGAIDAETDKEMAKDMEKVLDRYLKKAWTLICENAEFEAENDSVRINKDRKNARVITITVDGDAVATMVEGMVEYIVNDDDLKDLVVKYGDLFAEMLEEYADIEDIDDAYDDLMKELEDSAEDIVDGIEEAMSEELVITLVTPTMSSKLLMLNVEYDDTEVVSVQFGHEGLAKSENITVKIAGMYEVAYKISENTKDEYKATLEAMGEKIATIEVDKDKGEYELVLVDLCKVEGEMSTKGKVHTITVDNIGIYETNFDGTSQIDEEYKKLGITVILNEKDKMPKPEEKIESLLSLDEKELKKWNDRMVENGLPSFLKERLNGTYVSTVIGTSVSYTFDGDKVTMTVDLLGMSSMSATGTYEINDGWITFDFDDYEAYDYNGTYSFEKGDGYIEINDIEYEQK